MITYIIFTIWSMIGDDIRFLLFTIEWDIFFSILNFFVIFFYLTTFIYSMIYENDYFLQCYFYVDLISLVTLIFDNHWIYDAILKIQVIENIDYLKRNFLYLREIGEKAQEGKRIISYMKIFKLTRISRLYKILSNLQEKGFFQSQKENKNDPNLEEKEQNVASKFHELILKRVFYLILFMIFGIIFLDPSLYSKPSSSMKFGMKIFNFFDSFDNLIFNDTFNVYVRENLVKI